MSFEALLPIGSLVRPREERCYLSTRVKHTINQPRNKKIRYRKVPCDYIRVCSEENRERPPNKSRQLVKGQSAVVLEHGGPERYPMVKLLTGAGGSQWVGWALSEDVEPFENKPEPEVT